MSRILTASTLMFLLGTLGTGCTFDEELSIENMVGTVVIPRDLVERTYEVDGNAVTVADVRSIGPVYLGLYPRALEAEVIASFPHPATGPVFDTAQGVGDTYPYGGTTIGSLRSTCLEALQCRTVTGRYSSYDDMLTWFRDYINDPIVDWYDEPIQSGEELRQYCLTAFDFATDEELGLIVGDTNNDGTVDELDLDFVEREDGNFEAEFTIFQQEWFANPDDGTGFTLWGFVDNPARGDGEFKSCERGGFGESIDQYNQDFTAGTMNRDVLNRPSDYVENGDVVSGNQDQEGGEGTVGYVYDTIFDIPELWLNFEVQR